MKNFFKVVFSRAVFTGAFIALQFAAVYLAITRFNEHFAIFYGVCLVLSAVVVVYLVSRDGNPAYKIAWIIPILALPVFGVLLYLVFGKNQLSLKEKARMSSVAEQYEKAMRSVPAAEPALPEHTDAKRVSDYLHRTAGAPVFTHTETTYLPVGEVYFDTLLAELEKAEKFIFMEYYIIAPGTMWNAIHEVLRRKAESGVDVRVMYDDFGCMYKLPEGYEDTLEAEGIRCCVFNRFIPILSPRFNNRDHRKICVIDGNVGFTGGINFSDAYINVVQRCGHWLDAGVMLRGEGVYALTAMFLSMWDYTRGVTEDFTRYAPSAALCESITARRVLLPSSAKSAASGALPMPKLSKMIKKIRFIANPLSPRFYDILIRIIVSRTDEKKQASQEKCGKEHRFSGTPAFSYNKLALIFFHRHGIDDHILLRHTVFIYFHRRDSIQHIQSVIHLSKHHLLGIQPGSAANTGIL